MTSRKSEGFLHSRVRASYTLRSIWARILYHSKIFPENRLSPRVQSAANVPQCMPGRALAWELPLGSSHGSIEDSVARLQAEKCGRGVEDEWSCRGLTRQA
jgi:hypothetical protein